MTRSQLAALGVSAEMLTTRLRRRELLRVRRGVFVAAAGWPGDAAGQHLLRARAEVVANPGAAISHESAAIVWGLPSPGLSPWTDSVVSVSFPAGGRRRSSPRDVRHHMERLPSSHLTSDERGYAVTTLARTAVELAGTRTVPEGLALLDAAARGMCATYVVGPRRRDYANPRLAEAARAQLRTVAAELGRSRLVGVIGLVDPARESVAESLSAGHFQLAGIHRPLFNPPIHTPFGTFYPDCLWAEQGLIGECDGAVKYENAAAFVREKEREQVLRDLGYRMVRWLAREIMLHPEIVVDRVGRALAA